MKTLITYVHYERDFTKKNLDFFIKIGLTNSSDHQFNFVINSSTGGECIPRQSNVSVIKGHNEGYDFGGYKQSIQSVEFEKFERYIFINDTCRGPFLPSYIPDSLSWIDLLNSCIDNTTKLVGPSWNFSGKTPGVHLHIQSYCFVIDFIGLQTLLNKNIFDCNIQSKSKSKDKHDMKDLVIINHELKMSETLIESGFKIRPLQLSQYNGEQHGDICYDEKYYGTTLNPLEIMFIKTNRINNKILDNYTKWKIQETEK